LKIATAYLKRLLGWTSRVCRHFSGPLVAIATPLAVAWLAPAEFSFRFVGFLLQVLGVWIVWTGIRGTREQFAVPGWWAETKP
jgi:Na+/melibiose symporter-like transporter